MSCNNGIRLLLIILCLLSLAGHALGAGAGAPRSGELYQLSPPGTLQKIPAPPPYKPMPAQPTPARGRGRTGQSALRSGLRQTLFGVVSALVTFGVGHLIGVSIS